MPARPSVQQLLDQQRDRLDALCCDAADGIRGAVHFDELEAEAIAIARGLRDAFRKGAH